MSGLAKYTARSRRSDRPRCEVCGGAIGEEHRHLVDLDRRTIACACSSCASLSSGRLLPVPDRVLSDPALSLTKDDLAQLEIPVNLALVFKNGRLGRWIGLYPSPAGATERELDDPIWRALSERSALFTAASPDVEAVLFHQNRGLSNVEVMLVPIDVAYQLIALVRRHFKGFDGGEEMREAIEAFLVKLRTLATPILPPPERSPL
jgi:hypothetical protein